MPSQIEPPRPTTSPANAETRHLILALRAIAAIIITWHHFASYPPLAEWAAPLIKPVTDWLGQYARATQVFFVVGGYVMALSMAGRPKHQVGKQNTTASAHSRRSTYFCTGIWLCGTS